MDTITHSGELSTHSRPSRTGGPGRTLTGQRPVSSGPSCSPPLLSLIKHKAVSHPTVGRRTRVFAGQPEGLTRDDILDNVTLYWLTNTAVSSARLYWESKLAFFAPKGIVIPVAVSAFPDEIYTAPRSWTERAYPKLIHYNRLPKGGHFAAWEQPQLFAEELRAAFKTLR